MLKTQSHDAGSFDRTDVNKHFLESRGAQNPQLCLALAKPMEARNLL